MSRIRDCRQAMDHARDYTTWAQAAAEADQLTECNAWKEDERSTLFDYRLVRARLRDLRRRRKADDLPALMHELRQSLHWNIGGIGNPALYVQSHIGTKYLIADYIDEVCAAINYIADLPDHRVSRDERLRFLRETSLSFGRSGLMLSGGATLGMFHVGVIKTLWEHDALPRVISGSSAGSVVAATLGTRTDGKIEEIYDAEMARFGFWRGLSPASMIRRRALMDQAQVRRGIRNFVDNLTFEEAYQRTGRIINVTVSAANTNQPPKLVNHLTFPHLFIREAVLASCAVPLIFEPVVLYQRDERGNKVPFMPSAKWVDGSMKSDLPRLRMRRLHNVNHFIVSQTNPHVVPFMALRGSRSRGGRIGAVRAYAMASMKEQSRLAAGLARDLVGPGLVRRRLDALHGILEQDYRGHVTIVPPFRVRNTLAAAANPSLNLTREMILEGERATWPRLAMIRQQTRISQTFDRCLTRLGGSVQAADQLPEDDQRKAG